MLENLKNAGPRLKEGERSEVYRVRAPDAVHEWLSGMSAEERGQMLVAAQKALTGGAASRLRRLRRIAPEHLRPGYVPPAPPEEPTLEGVTVLRVVSPKVPQPLRNRLRWSPERYQALEDKLSRTETLTLERVNGKAIWRTSSGEAIRRDTVLRLLEAGSLVPGLTTQLVV